MNSQNAPAFTGPPAFTATRRERETQGQWLMVSGGLLLAIDPSQAPALLEALRSGPAPAAAIIGSTQASDPGKSSLLWLDSGNIRKREGCEI